MDCDVSPTAQFIEGGQACFNFTEICVPAVFFFASATSLA